MLEHREIAAPVGLDLVAAEPAAGGLQVRLRNRQHFRDLSWLAGEWQVLVDGDHRGPALARTAPARLPELPPGRAATVPVPPGLLDGLPANGEAWLTLQVTTADDEAWAPSGTAVCTPQVRLRHEDRDLAARAGAGTRPAGPGIAVHLDAPRQVSVTRYRAAELAAATHHDELVPRAHCVVHIDAAHRGLGTASCGPDTLPR
jgi:beta-galactosidase